MAFGSMFPGAGGPGAVMPMGGNMPQIQPMAVPAMTPDDNAGIGMKILQAALQRQGQGAPQVGSQGAVQRSETGQEPATSPAAVSPPTSLAAPAPNAGVGMLARLFNRLGATGVQNQGGPGPAPTALTGLW